MKKIAVIIFIIVTVFLWYKAIQNAKTFTSQWKSTNELIQENDWRQ